MKISTHWKCHQDRHSPKTSSWPVHHKNGITFTPSTPSRSTHPKNIKIYTPWKCYNTHPKNVKIYTPWKFHNTQPKNVKIYKSKNVMMLYTPQKHCHDNRHTKISSSTLHKNIIMIYTSNKCHQKIHIPKTSSWSTHPKNVIKIHTPQNHNHLNQN